MTAKTVTPFVGVWIEIIRLCQKRLNGRTVTPFVGVWIEIRYIDVDGEKMTVTPFVGVWIEICKYLT